MSKNLKTRFKKFQKASLQEEIKLGLEPLPSVVLHLLLTFFFNLLTIKTKGRSIPQAA